MTARRQPDLDRLVADFLHAEAPPRASARILEGVVAEVAKTPQERGILDRLPLPDLRGWATLPRSARVAVSVALLVLALAGTVLLVGAIAPRLSAPVPTSYQAVLVRQEQTGTGGPADITVVALAKDGTERVVAVFPDLAWDFPGFDEHPEARLTQSGLLAVHFARDETQEFYWRIVDLSEPGRAPIDVLPDFFQEPQVGAFGPDDQFAAWTNDSHPSPDVSIPAIPVIDGRTGTATLHELEVSPSLNPSFPEGLVWTPRGVIVGSATEHTTVLDGVLVLDTGAVEPFVAPVLDDGVGARYFRTDGARLEHVPAAELVQPARGAQPVTGLGDIRNLADLAWAANQQDMWALTWAFEGDGRAVTVSRRAPDGALTPITMITSTDVTEPEPGTFYSPANFSGHAPDDSVIRLGVAGTDGPWHVDAQTGRAFVVHGSLAGWLTSRTVAELLGG